jgi:hypothetical protein
MMPAIPALLVATQLAIPVADKVPTLNIDASCRAAMKATIGLQQDMSACMSSENAARDQLAKEWSKFPAGDRSSCLSLTRTGTTGTYTELLTCVEMKRDARQLPQEINTIGKAEK